MVISFTSEATGDTRPKVHWGLAQLGEDSGYNFKFSDSAHGATHQYSQQYYFSSELWDPILKGGFTLTRQQVANIQTTADWAYYDHTPDRHFPGYVWQNVTAENIRSGLGAYFNPKEHYDSPAIHTVVLRGLEGGRPYRFRVDNDNTIYTFRMPSERAEYPFLVGILADVGQTQVSKSSFDILRFFQPEVILLAGDLSYADGFYDRWDSFGRILEPLGAEVPIMSCPGNHETSDAEAYQSYLARFPMPHAASGSINPTIWSRDIGPMHVIALNSYAGSSPKSYQYKWLKHDLEHTFSRKRTPWLVVLMHTPFYNSNSGHQGEAKIMRDNMEDMLYENGANLIINGHVHSYERTWPVYKNITRKDACAPIYLNVGDAGNREGPYGLWLPGENSNPQPEWSAFREGSFGVAKLVIESDVHMKLEWIRNACFNSTDGRPIWKSENCRTAGDNSIDAGKPTDAVSIRRPRHCRQMWPDSAQLGFVQQPLGSIVV